MSKLSKLCKCLSPYLHINGFYSYILSNIFHSPFTPYYIQNLLLFLHRTGIKSLDTLKFKKKNRKLAWIKRWFEETKYFVICQGDIKEIRIMLLLQGPGLPHPVEPTHNTNLNFQHYIIFLTNYIYGCGLICKHATTNCCYRDHHPV